MIPIIRTRYITRCGMKLTVRTKTTIEVEFSDDMGDCIAAQLGELLNGEPDPKEKQELRDLADAINEGLR